MSVYYTNISFISNLTYLPYSAIMGLKKNYGTFSVGKICHGDALNVYVSSFTSNQVCGITAPKGAKYDWDFGSLIWSRTLIVLIFNLCGEFR